MNVRRCALPLGTLLVIACGAEKSPTSAATGGTFVFAIAGEPEHLVPPQVATVQGKMIVDLVYEPLAEVGKEGNTLGDRGFIPRAASAWSWNADSSALTLSVNPKSRFHDGRPVTAADVKFSYDVYMDPAVASPHVSSFPAIDSLVVADSMTVKAWFAERSPERFFKLVTNLIVMPQHALASVDHAKLVESPFAASPIGSGPYKVAKWERGVSLALVADTARPAGRPGPDRLLFRYVTDLNAAAQSVEAGESDFSESLRPEAMAAVRPDGPARAVEFPSPDHGYLLFNTRNPKDRKAPHGLFGNRELRRAIGMALDRRAVVRNALDSLARLSYGPFVSSGWASDTTIAQIPFDAEGSKRLLDSLGWKDGNGDGIREKGGAPLRFTLSVPSVSATRKQMAVALQAQLRQVGVEVVIDAPEPAVLFPQLTQGKFDAFIQVWHEDATPSTLAQVWSGRDLEHSANYGWYANASVDTLIEGAVREVDPAKARALYRQAYERIVQDAPAIFLWEPRTFALVHKRIRYGALSGLGWWTGIASWTVPEGERIDRDRVK